MLRTFEIPAQESQLDYLRVAIRAFRQKLELTCSRAQLIIIEPAVGCRLAAGEGRADLELTSQSSKWSNPFGRGMRNTELNGIPFRTT